MDLDPIFTYTWPTFMISSILIIFLVMYTIFTETIDLLLCALWGVHQNS